MSVLQHKIDFVALVRVENANPNGDPLGENIPRTTMDGRGIMSQECIKRKIRNRMQDLGNQIFVQSDDRIDDGFRSLSQRASTVLRGSKNTQEYTQKACETWLDVRSFGQVFAFKNSDDDSCHVQGPVTIHDALSITPVEVESMKITKSTNGEDKASKASDTMGWRHFVWFGLYVIKGSINVRVAEKTGLTDDDVQVIKECLRTLFVNDASAARPDGSMEVFKLFWWEHNCKDGQYSSYVVHNSVKVDLKPDVVFPSKMDDYDISVLPLDGLSVEEIKGI